MDLRVRPLSDGLLRAELHGTLHARVRNIVDRTLRKQGLLKLNQLLFILWLFRWHGVNLILHSQWHLGDLNIPFISSSLTSYIVLVYFRWIKWHSLLLLSDRRATIYASFFFNNRRYLRLGWLV